VIKRLQRKFVAIAMGSLTLIMLIVIGSINMVNLYHMDRMTDGMIYMIADNEGGLPRFDRTRPPPAFKFRFEFLITPETSFEPRHFSAKITEDGAIISVDTSYIASISREDAWTFVEEIIAGNKTKGYRDGYKYRIIQKPYGAMAVILDCRIHLQSANVLLVISCVVVLCSIGLMFILVSALSKRALRPAQISIEKQKQFITDAGHEIKTPLAIISSNADVLELTYGKSEWISSIHNQTARLDNLVKKLLTLSKLEEEAATQTHKEFDLGSLVRDVVTAFQPLADSCGKSVICDTPPCLMFCGDEDEICHMASILLDNAIKYGASDGNIKIKLSRQVKKIIMEIRNNLNEPPADYPDQLFDRFFRADCSRSRETGGYGLGLSIARAVARAHKGDLTVAYENDKRVICFRVQLYGR